MLKIIGADIVIWSFLQNNNMKVKEMPLSQCPISGFENYYEY